MFVIIHIIIVLKVQRKTSVEINLYKLFHWRITKTQKPKKKLFYLHKDIYMVINKGLVCQIFVIDLCLWYI